MTEWRYLKRIDLRVLGVIGALMAISLVVIASHTASVAGEFFTPKTLVQLRWFVLGTAVFCFCAAIDYNRLREATWVLYGLMIVSLLALFVVAPIQGVHRWFTIPILHFRAQPSELAKLVVVLTLSWYLERNRHRADRMATVAGAGLIVGIPFLLILKQPDLGTAMVLWPITLVIFYFGGINRRVVRAMTIVSGVGVVAVMTIFLGVIDHEEFRPVATKFIKNYQYERLNPHTHHQRAASTAIALGGVKGTGWRKSEYGGQGWLPAAETDSVFPAFAEEFGLIGVFLVLALYYALIYFGFQVTAVAKDHFGRLLSAGITVYLAMHVLTNLAMMCGLLPITGVPLLLVTYGGSSVLVTMAALGVLQSVYTRRFTF